MSSQMKNSDFRSSQKIYRESINNWLLIDSLLAHTDTLMELKIAEYITELILNIFCHSQSQSYESNHC